MAKGFSEEERERLRATLIEEGFSRLKSGGLRAVNMEEIARACYISKGSVFNLFPSKTDFLYQIMLTKRQQTKERLKRYLDADGRLPFDGLYRYLSWMCEENPNIFSYISAQETKWLVSRWPIEFLQNCENDEETAAWIISYLKTPRPTPDWQQFCNFLKLGAWALSSPDYLIREAAPRTIEQLIRMACESISEDT